MAYYYVKTGGTKTTGSLTKQTGSFTTLGVANYYATIALAITGGATSGDYICVSDAHAYTNAGDILLTGPGSGGYLNVISVSENNCDTYAKATTAQEHMTASTGKWQPAGRVVLHGIYIKSGDDIRPTASDSILSNDCTFEWTASGGILFLSGDGLLWRSQNCEYKMVSGTVTRIDGAATAEMSGCSFTGITTFFSSSTGQNGGSTVRIDGTDLSSLTGYLVANGGNSGTADDAITFEFHGCKLNASLTDFWNETKENYNHRITVTNSDSDPDVAEYQFHHGSYAGRVDQHNTIYRDGSTAFPSGAKISLACVTLLTATKTTPFTFDFPTRYAELSNTASDTLRVYLQSNTQLYDSDVWLEVTYPDSTAPQLANYINTQHDNVLDTNGTELATNTEAWSGTAQTYQYQIDISIADGADCYPTVRVYVAKASATIYFDSELTVIG